MKITTQQYATTLLELTDGKTEQEVLAAVIKFTQQLKKDGQLKNADAIMKKFAELYNKKHGIVSAQVVTRQKSESLNTKKIEEFIKVKYNAKEVECESIVDENIKGGIIIKVGDEVIDGSVAAHLKKLKNILTK